MRYSFLRSSLPGIAFTVLFFMCSAVVAQETPASHRERFAPREQTLRKAEQDLDAKLSHHPDDGHLLSDRGLLRLETKRTEEALADLRKACQLLPADAQMHVNLAYGLLVSGHSSEAVDEAGKALSLDPNHAAAHALLGGTLIVSDDSIKNGIEHLQRALAIFPDQPNLRFVLVNALRK